MGAAACGGVHMQNVLSSGRIVFYMPMQTPAWFDSAHTHVTTQTLFFMPELTCLGRRIPEKHETCHPSHKQTDQASLQSQTVGQFGLDVNPWLERSA